MSSGGEDLLHETYPRRGFGKATGMEQTKPPARKGRYVTSLKTPSSDIQQHGHHGAFSPEFPYEQHNTGNKQWAVIEVIQKTSFGNMPLSKAL